MSLPGYTLSLLLWIVPVIALTGYLVGHDEMSKPVRRALGWSIALITILGSLLDLAFAHLFFTFPNPRAILGIYVHKIPVEEFGFYLFGGWFIALFYVFCDEVFLARYNRPDQEYRRWARRLPRLFLPTAKGWVALLIIALGSIGLKHWLNPTGLSVPGYFLFLLLAAYTPFVLFDRIVRRFVNWQGYWFTLAVTLFISLTWEVTLALPYGWWGYQEGAMLGISIPFWNRLPFEALTVWVFSSLAIFVYEAIKIGVFRGTTPNGSVKEPRAK